MELDWTLEVVVAGHICLDITPNFPRLGQKDLKALLRPGRLTNVAGVQIATGGAVSNTGIALSILGIQTELMGKIGQDYFGEGILRLLRTWGLDTGMTVDPQAATSYTIVIVPPGTDRIFLHDPGANDTFTAEDIQYALTGKARLFHFGYPTIMRSMYQGGCQALQDVFKRVKDQGVTTSLDMTLPDPTSESGRMDWDHALQKVLPLVDLFVPSLEELLYMTEPDLYRHLLMNSPDGDVLSVFPLDELGALGDKLLGYGAKAVLIKCGSKGCYLRTASGAVLAQMGRGRPQHLEDWAERELFEGVFAVPQVMSATGAGDTCIAGFLAGLLRGWTAQQSLRLACGVGAECVQAYDALSGIKTMEETQRKIDAGWEKAPLAIPGNYWRHFTKDAVWLGQADRTIREE